MNVTVEETRKVTLSPAEVRRVAVAAICEKVKLPKPDCYINEDGYLAYEYEDRRGSHSSFETEIVRVATDDDRAAVKILELFGRVV
jgi:hypothetical protein